MSNGYFPPIFYHPRFMDTRQPPPPTTDPAIVPEHFSVVSGTPLQVPNRVTNRYVREMAETMQSTAAFRTGDADNMPHVSYMPGPVPDGQPDLHQPVLPEVYRDANSPLMRTVTEVHQLQQANLQRQSARRAARGKGKGKAEPLLARLREQMVVYDGTDESCSICQSEFLRQEYTYRLTCNHLFHQECYDHYIHNSFQRSNTCECPNCRGPGTVKALFRHLGTTTTEDARDSALRAAQQYDAYEDAYSVSASQSASASRSVSASLQSHEPIFITAEELSEWSSSYSTLSPETYILKKYGGSKEKSRDQISTSVHIKQTTQTKLPNGRNSILIDLGSRINIIGSDTEKEFALEAERNGHQTTYEQRQHRLNVNGVGAGSAPCDVIASTPIAVSYDGDGASLHQYKANIAGGSGSSLPAILGSISMQEKDAVIILRKGKEVIAFPGKGGYRIHWSAGTKLLPMVPAPSGHLVVPCDEFSKINGGKTDAAVFTTDHTTDADQS